MQYPGSVLFLCSLQGYLSGKTPLEIIFFLDVKEGKKQLIQLHGRLYSGALSSFSSEIPYSPHMTLGNLENRNALHAAYETVKSISESFSTVADTISVEKIGKQGESIILMEKNLR